MQCLKLDDMYVSLPDLKHRSPLFDVSSSQGAFFLLFKAFFILLMYWLIHVLAFHSDVSAVPIVGCPCRLLLLLLLKLDHASKCGVARFVIKELNKSFIS